MPPEGGGGGDIPLGAEKRMRHHDCASLISSWYGVPPVRRSPRCAWGWSVAWDTGLPHKTLLQPPNAGTAEPFRVSPPEAVAYPLELARKTNHIERFNNTLRQRVSRLVRSALSFSKTLANHIGAIKYFICHYNLTKAAV